MNRDGMKYSAVRFRIELKMCTAYYIIRGCPVATWSRPQRDDGRSAGLSIWRQNNQLKDAALVALRADEVILDHACALPHGSNLFINRQVYS